LDCHQHHWSARWPRAALRSLDQQRNDHLGWYWRHRLVEHWRQILRRRAESDTYANRDSHAHGDDNGHRYSDFKSDCDARDAHSDPVHRKVHTDPEAAADRDGAAYSAATPDARTYSNLAAPYSSASPVRQAS